MRTLGSSSRAVDIVGEGRESLRRATMSIKSMGSWCTPDGTRNAGTYSEDDQAGVLVDIYTDSIDLTYNSDYFDCRHTVRLRGNGAGYWDRPGYDCFPTASCTIPLSRLIEIADQGVPTIDPDNDYDYHGEPVDRINDREAHWSVTGDHELLRAMEEASKLAPTPSDRSARYPFGVIDISPGGPDGAYIHAACSCYVAQWSAAAEFSRLLSMRVESDMAAGAANLYRGVQHSTKEFVRIHRYSYSNGVTNDHKTYLSVGDSTWVAFGGSVLGWNRNLPDLAKMIDDTDRAAVPQSYAYVRSSALRDIIQGAKDRKLEAIRLSVPVSPHAEKILTVSATSVGGDHVPWCASLPMGMGYYTPGAVEGVDLDPTYLLKIIDAVRDRGDRAHVGISWSATSSPVVIRGDERVALLMPQNLEAARKAAKKAKRRNKSK